MVMARRWLSAFRVPSTRIASPLERTTSRMNLFDGMILSRSVHHRNLFRGAGYPLPIRLTQNVFSTSGVSLCGTNRQPLLARRRAHPRQRRINPGRDQRLLDQRVRRDHVHRLRPLGGRQLADCQPDQLQRRARVFAAAVTDDPGNAIALVELPDLFADGLDGPGQSRFGKGRRWPGRGSGVRRAGHSSPPGNRFQSLLLGRELEPEVLLDQVARQHDIDPPLGQAAGVHGPSLPELGVVAGPVEGFQAAEF